MKRQWMPKHPEKWFCEPHAAVFEGWRQNGQEGRSCALLHLGSNIFIIMPWCRQENRAFYSNTLFHIVLWNWCHEVWPSRRAKRVYLSKYRLTWSIASTSYSKRFSRVVGYFWVLNRQLDWIPIGVVWNSWRSPRSLGRLPSFFWMRCQSEYWRSRRIALMRMVISTSFMVIENLFGEMEPYKLWRTLTGLRLTSFHCQVASFFPPLSSSNFLSFTQPAGMLLPGAPTMNALSGVVSGHLNEGPKNLHSEFSRLVKHTRHTLDTYVFLTQVDLHSSSGARARHDVDRDRFGAEGVSMLRPKILEGRTGVRVRTITPSWSVVSTYVKKSCFCRCHVHVVDGLLKWPCTRPPRI